MVMNENMSSKNKSEDDKNSYKLEKKIEKYFKK